MAHLTIVEKGSQRVHQLEDDYATIGRADSNAITLLEAKASKEHARLQAVGERWKLIDLESKNGTRVNGEYRNKSWLEPGDVIRIGKTEMTFSGARRSIVRDRRRGDEPLPTLTPVPVGGAPATDEANPDLASARERGEERGNARSSRYREPADDWIKWGLTGLGIIVILVIVNAVGGKASADPHNVAVIKTADKLLADRKWDEAIRYLRANGDPSGNGYREVERRIRDLQKQLPEHQKNMTDQLARSLASKLGMKIRLYHRGRDQLTSAEDVMTIVKRLETECAGTDTLRNAREEWPEWFSGDVPERGSDLVGDRYRRPWEKVLKKADNYRKEGYFREAQETVLKFVSTREAVMDADDLDKYRRLAQERVVVYRKAASSHYYSTRQRADRLVRNKRFDQAIKAYQDVVDRIGVDEFVRKAKGEILKIENLKARGDTPDDDGKSDDGG